MLDVGGSKAGGRTGAKTAMPALDQHSVRRRVLAHEARRRLRVGRCACPQHCKPRRRARTSGGCSGRLSTFRMMLGGRGRIIWWQTGAV